MGGLDGLLEPRGHAVAKVGDGDAGAVGAGGEVGGVVGVTDHPKPQAAGVKDHRAAGLVQVGAGSDGGDAGSRELVEGVQQRLGPVVQGAVVGQGHAADVEQPQRLDRSGWGAEEERLARCRPALPAGRDAAFEVEYDQVGGPHRLDHCRGDQRGGRQLGQSAGHRPAKHRVAGQRHRRGHRDRHSGTLPALLAVGLLGGVVSVVNGVDRASKRRWAGPCKQPKRPRQSPAGQCRPGWACRAGHAENPSPGPGPKRRWSCGVR